MNADSMTQLMKIALVISIVSVVAVMGLAFAVFSTNDALGHIYRVLNSTRTGP